MTFVIGGKVRDLMWMADPPKFYEVELDENEQYVLDALGCLKRTGRVIKGNSARKLMQRLNEVKGYGIGTNGYDEYPVEIKGKLPKQWLLDINWEFGYQWLRNVKGDTVTDRFGNPIPLDRGQKGIPKGRRHAVWGTSERGVLVNDFRDLKLITWWKRVYPDIPHEVISRDYYWKLWDGYVTEVLAKDAELIMRACVGEFLDVTKTDGTLPPVPEVILIGGQ